MRHTKQGHGATENKALTFSNQVQRSKNPTAASQLPQEACLAAMNVLHCAPHMRIGTMW